MLRKKSVTSTSVVRGCTSYIPFRETSGILVVIFLQLRAVTAVPRVKRRMLDLIMVGNDKLVLPEDVLEGAQASEECLESNKVYQSSGNLKNRISGSHGVWGTILWDGR